jgi:hypothetical protein
MTTEQQVRPEGGHMSATAGTVIFTPHAALHYKVILTHQDVPPTEHAFATMREADAFIRRNTPVAVGRATLFDRPAI